MPNVICILGMHRSGTSAITRVLNLLGVDLGSPTSMVAAAADNPKGFWEHQKIMELNVRILSRLGVEDGELPMFRPGWAMSPVLEDLRREARILIERDFGNSALWGWKDPRTCVTLPFWQQILPQMRYVLCFRNPADVARSLDSRNKVSLERSLSLWLTHVRSSLAYTNSHPRLFVFYEELLSSWKSELTRLATFVGRPEFASNPLIQEQVRGFLDQKLHHHATPVTAADEANLSASERALRIAQSIYVGLQETDAADEVRMNDQFQKALDLISPHVQQEQKARQHWKHQSTLLFQEIAQLVPAGETFILVDDEQWGARALPDRHTLPFIEHDGQYWGPPGDDQTANSELERLRENGAKYLVVTWPSFWWLDFYKGFNRHLRESYPCLLENERLIAFDLRKSIPPAGMA